MDGTGTDPDLLRVRAEAIERERARRAGEEAIRRGPREVPRPDRVACSEECRSLSRKSLSRFTIRGHTSFVWSLAFSPDGTTLASGSGDFTVRLWDTAPLKARYQARREAEALRPYRFLERRSLYTRSPTGCAH